MGFDNTQLQSLLQHHTLELDNALSVLSTFSKKRANLTDNPTDQVAYLLEYHTYVDVVLYHYRLREKFILDLEVSVDVS